MDIFFQDVMPFPLESIHHNDDSIWGKKFKLKQGQKVVLNASSGKGKSTFSGILFGLRDDFNGNLLFNNKSIKDFSRLDWSDFRKSKLSIVFQDLQLFDNLTVKENLVLKNDLTKSFSELEIKDLVCKLGIIDKWEVKCGLLSMGQKQRVAIIRALLQPFHWLILDEPFSHLDINNTNLCLELINERCLELNAGFIITTLGSKHDFSFDIELKL